MAKSSPLERTSVQLMIGAALLALLANSAVDQTDDKLPWEVTLTGFCLFAVVFAAIYAKRTEVAVSIVTIVGMIVPTYFVHYMEVPCSNWLLGSQFPLAAPPKEVLAGIFAAAPNASRYDGLLPGGLSVYHFSLFNPSMAVTANTSEIYHSGLMLDDKLTKARTHDYLLLSSPRKVRRKTEAVSILARVPTKFVVWPPEAEDYSFSLQTASNMVMPPTLIGELCMANVEWEDDVVVVYFQGKQGLELRRYMREDAIGEPEMCVAWRIPTSKGMVEWVRVFKEKMDGLPNDPVDTKAPIG